MIQQSSLSSALQVLVSSGVSAVRFVPFRQRSGHQEPELNLQGRYRDPVDVGPCDPEGQQDSVAVCWSTPAPIMTDNVCFCEVEQNAEQQLMSLSST